ncbi:MAG: transcription antitermination factor NusB [Planctomycetota bacterium]
MNAHDRKPRLSPARRFALDSLLAPRRASIHLEDLLRAGLPSASLGDDDRRLAFELAVGAVKRRATLKHLVCATSGVPRSRIQKKVLVNLELAFYQLLFLDRVPPYAAVSESVELAKRWGARPARFTNAVLRSFADSFTREADRGPLETDPRTLPVSRTTCVRFRDPVFADPGVALVEHLSQVYSLPPWLLSRWVERFSERVARDLALCANDPPPLFVRIDPRTAEPSSVRAFLSEGGAAFEETQRPDTLLLERGFDLSALVSRSGLFVQDLSSMEVVDALDVEPSHRVLDLCAAPGAKSAQIASALGPEGFLLAVDVDERKLPLIRENLAKTRLKAWETLAADGRRLPSLVEAKFDRVLLDAPCTNTGVLRRRAEARWRAGDKALRSLVSLQRELLAAAWRMVAPLGRLVYSTCSLEREENEDASRDFLRAAPEAKLLHERVCLPAWRGPDGGYYAVIERSG